MLLECIRELCGVFPEVSPQIIQILMDEYLTLEESAPKITATTTTKGKMVQPVGPSCTLEVMYFIRKQIELYPESRGELVDKLTEYIGVIRHSDTLQVGLWVVGEYSEGSEGLGRAIDTLREYLGQLPIIMETQNKRLESERNPNSSSSISAPRIKLKTVILADGTYGTQEVIDAPALVSHHQDPGENSHLRNLLAGRDFALAASLGVTFTKLLLRLRDRVDVGVANSHTVEVLLVLCALLKLDSTEVGGYILYYIYIYI